MKTAYPQRRRFQKSSRCSTWYFQCHAEGNKEEYKRFWPSDKIEPGWPAFDDSDVLAWIPDWIQYRSFLWNQRVSFMQDNQKKWRCSNWIRNISSFRWKGRVMPFRFKNCSDWRFRAACRASKKKSQLYSGKKKCFIQKVQTAVDFEAGEIFSSDFCHGRTHDFRLFKEMQSRGGASALTRRSSCPRWSYRTTI